MCFLANYELEVVKKLPADLEPGVYYGWAQIDNGPIYKMVANIGWCPFYNNAEKSVVSVENKKIIFSLLGILLKS